MFSDLLVNSLSQGKKTAAEEQKTKTKIANTFYFIKFSKTIKRKKENVQIQGGSKYQMQRVRPP